MPKTMDPDMQAFQAELLEAVRDMKVGRAARTTTWTALDEWVDRWSTPTPVDGPDDAPTSPSAPRADRIGSNPARRYGSASSRAFG